MKEKFLKINQSKLPEKVKNELKAIQDGTENFSDDELIAVYKDNFDDLYKIIDEKYPEAVGKKAVVKKAAKKPVKKVKPATEKSEDVSKDLDDCEEVVKAARAKDRKENPPVKHTAETRLGSILGKLVNLVIEKIGDDEPKLKAFKTDVLAFEMKVRGTYLGLKRDNIREDLKEKIEEAIEKTE